MIWIQNQTNIMEKMNMFKNWKAKFFQMLEKSEKPAQLDHMKK